MDVRVYVFVKVAVGVRGTLKVWLRVDENVVVSVKVRVLVLVSEADGVTDGDWDMVRDADADVVVEGVELGLWVSDADKVAVNV